MSQFAPTPRTTLKRLPDRAVFDRAAVHAILDEGLVCHVGFVVDGQPFVIPTIYARIGDRLYVHGAAASRMLRSLAGRFEICVTVTLLDGLVLARSAFHHSMNYRSVVVVGRAHLVEDAAEKRAALKAVVEHVVPGRSAAVREPSEKELLATSVLRLDFPIVGLTKLIQVLRWPRLVLMAVWPGEMTPGFLHLTLTILNSLIWGIGLAGLKVLWSKMRS